MNSTHFADRLLAAIDSKGGAPVCVGIDPVFAKLPADLRDGAETPDDEIAAICEFTEVLLDAVADTVPIVKFQSACFERYREAGVESLYSLIRVAADKGLLVILDAKRGDIGISADHYATGIFSPPVDPALQEDCEGRPDALTINAYLGTDGIEPFCQEGRGAFALVRTSNPGGDEIQQALLDTGHTVAEHVALTIDRISRNYLGESGYSSLGAVVGATKRDEIQRLRMLMPHCLFLVPGYGAQGGSAADVRACFDNRGRGALITASRSVIYAFDSRTPAGRTIDETGSDAGLAPWADAIATAAVRFAEEIKAILP